MPSNKAGFSLIEVLVALTLLGFIAAMLASGTRLGIDISGRGNAKVDAIRLEHIQDEAVREQIQGALPYRYWTRMDTSRTEHVAFDGGPGRLRFISRYGLLDGRDNLPRWVEIRSREDSNSKTMLVVEERRILSPDNQAADQVIASAEISNCSDARLQYLELTDKDPPNWASAWDGSDRKALPPAVRLKCGEEGRTKFLVTLDYAASAKQGLWLQ